MTGVEARLCCPAYGLGDAGRRERVRVQARALVESAGWRVAEGPTLAEDAVWLDVDARAAELAWACAGDVVWAARGGYGCVHLLERLPVGPLPLLVGFSDLTALHLAWHARGSRGVYGAMPGWPAGATTATTLRSLIRGEAVRLPVRTLGAGTATGWLMPACLRVLAGLAGTPHLPSLAGCILAVEDIDEAPYRIDRDLFQLHASGALRGITGLVGDFAGSAAGTGPSSDDILAAWGRRLGVPVAAAAAFGHREDHHCLPVGGRAVLADGVLEAAP